MEVGAQLLFQVDGVSWQPTQIRERVLSWQLDKRNAMWWNAKGLKGRTVSFSLSLTEGLLSSQHPLNLAPGCPMTAPISIRYWPIVSRLEFKSGVFELGFVPSAGLYSLGRISFRQDIHDESHETVGPGHLCRWLVVLLFKSCFRAVFAASDLTL
jgi:hypothetical protein